MQRLEILTLVIYDISDDKTRTKVSGTCLDFGLERIQYSAFQGLLSRNRRQELALKLTDELRLRGGRISLIPICQADLPQRIDLDVAPAADGSPGALKLFGGNDP